MDLPPQTLQRSRLPAAISIGLLLTSILWIGIWIALIIVALHAESFRDVHRAPAIIWAMGLLMIVAGAIGAALATDELAGSKHVALRIVAAWLWIMAIAVTVGWLAGDRYPKRWPILEILLGTLATALAIAAAPRVPVLRTFLNKNPAPSSPRAQSV